MLPTKGQRTELSGELVGGPLGGDRNFYKMEMKTGLVFQGIWRRARPGNRWAGWRG